MKESPSLDGSNLNCLLGYPYNVGTLPAPTHPLWSRTGLCIGKGGMFPCICK